MRIKEIEINNFRAFYGKHKYRDCNVKRYSFITVGCNPLLKKLHIISLQLHNVEYINAVLLG